MELAFREYGQGDPLIILHGLFGNSDNWATLAKQFGEHYTTFTPDLRNHGQSPHVADMSYEEMAEDVRYFMEGQWVHHAYLMGHSMGGKVAMQLALNHPELVDKLIIVDMAPRKYPGGHEEIFQTMLDLKPEQIESRKEAEDQIAKRIPEKAIQQFLLKNLLYDQHLKAYKWRINLPAIYEAYPSILEEVESGTPFEKPVLFLYGGRSSYVREEDKSDIIKLFPQAKFEEVADAGHWVHAEQPKAVYDAVRRFLS